LTHSLTHSSTLIDASHTLLFIERLVQEALDRIRAQRKLTTVTVAHRLSTIVNSDQIAVIADGSIQELGTHKNLIKEGGIYALLCEGQGLTADAASNNNTTTKSSDSTPAAIPTLGLAASPKEGAIETSMVKTGNEDDVEAGIITIDEEEDDDDGVPDTSGVLSRLWQYNKAETGYTILGYLGGMIVGALPACEAILFGIITGNFYLIEDPQEMRATNFSLSLWFLVLAAASFVANIAMGVGFVSSVCFYWLSLILVHHFDLSDYSTFMVISLYLSPCCLRSFSFYYIIGYLGLSFNKKNACVGFSKDYATQYGMV
jgi:hypothetical protein